MRRFAILLILGAAACSADTDDLVDRDGGASRDAGVVRDAGESRDGGVPRDGGFVDGGPARTLVEFSLLGDSPPDNLVMNPNLTTLSTVGPFANAPQSTTRHLAHTPTRQPAFEVVGGDQVILFVQAEPGITTASVWFGWRGDQVGDAEALILALAKTQIDAVVQLVPTGAPTKLDEITWQRFEGETTLDLVGSNFMFFENPTGAPMFVTGPTVVARQGRIIGSIESPRPTISAAQRAKAATLVAKHREALFRDMKPVRPRPLQTSGSSER